MSTESRRLRLRIRGAVQGVGFRPHVYRLAIESGLTGWVLNSPRGVTVEVEGRTRELETFGQRLVGELPPNAEIRDLERVEIDPVGDRAFRIRDSDLTGPRSAVLLADLATCAECLRELFAPEDRRFRYPFANCTHCGPRYTIIESLPYDRPNTTMRRFEMCADCRREYEDPLDRRFHAQPVACPACGPQLELWDSDGGRLATGEDALLGAARQIREGRIVAVKGLGGFHLFTDATNPAGVRRLRARKRRAAKPFALMFPGVEAVRGACELSAQEERLLASPQAPIVLLRRRAGTVSAASIAEEVAPNNPLLGAMLPYTPLHHLMLRELGVPLVATSANLSEEPICFDQDEALRRLAGIADLFLVHDRPIARPVDDSVVRVALGRELPLRRARGYAPMPLRVVEDLDAVLAVGAHLKNTVALGLGRDVFVSPHVGDLEGRPSMDAFQRNVECLRSVYEIERPRVARDLHPDYLSTRYAEREAESSNRPAVAAIQHHFAHVVACMADNGLDEPVLGVSWDGTGYGPDGTVWGGEFLDSTRGSYSRVARLRPFPLPGGDAAVREPRRSGLGLLHSLLGESAFQRTDRMPLDAFDAAELRVLRRMLAAGVNAPMTSSAGRLFDGVASIVGLRQLNRFEGQAAMDLEFAARPKLAGEPYPIPLRTVADGTEERTKPRWELDWRPMLSAILDDVAAGTAVTEISARFHAALAGSIVAVARAAERSRVVLTGGCFQNVTLLEQAVALLRRGGFRPAWHNRVPPNDGGISLGQAVASHYVVKSGDLPRAPDPPDPDRDPN